MVELIRKISQGYKASESELKALHEWNMKNMDDFLAQYSKGR